MKRTILIVAGSLLLGAPAIAQSSDRPYERSDQSRDRRDQERNDWRDRNTDGGRGWTEHERSARSDDEGGGMQRRAGRNRGARFFIKSGDTEIKVKCDAQESMRACVDAVTSLMERSRAMSGSAATSPPATTPPASSAPAKPGGNL
jgi:hypothetical protein